MNKTCVYYCEGEDDQKLIDALKVNPSKILPGKSKKLNVVQSLIPKSILLGIKPDTYEVCSGCLTPLTKINGVRSPLFGIEGYD